MGAEGQNSGTMGGDDTEGCSNLGEKIEAKTSLRE